MKRSIVDYRALRLSNITSPQYRHLLLLLGWVGYFALYFLTENLIPAAACHPVHIFLDDLIPFNEYFTVFYVGWYALVFGSLAWYLFVDVDRFKQLQIFIIVTQVVAMAAYILYPTRQDLRPIAFEHNNLFTWLLGSIYAFDTSTGVCPSLHVAYSLGILSVFLKDENAARWWKVCVCILVACICASVCFVKQHSALDVLCALPVGLLAEALVYHRWWRQRLRKKATV